MEMSRVCRKEIVMNSSATVNFWERLWRSSGIIFGIFFVVAYAFYDLQPKIGASADTLVSFYEGNRMRVLMATMLFGWGVLFLLWFAAAIRSVLHDAGQGGWGAAAASSAVLWGLIAVVAALAYSIVGLGNDALTSGLNDLVWTGIVVSSLPRALLIMAGTFGLWRAKMISNALFGAGVAAILLVLVGCTTWASEGIWAPSGDYTRFVSPIVGLVWIVVFSGVLLTRRSPSTTPQAPEPPAAAPAS
jgi:succinate dehydrogenase/fumarate reductase cytochrome b subunit